MRPQQVVLDRRPRASWQARAQLDLAAGLEAGLIDAREAELLRAAERARERAIQVDSFGASGAPAPAL